MNLRDILHADYSARKWLYASFLVIAVITAAVYSPSLFHAARSDHLAYLADTARMDGDFRTLAVESYAFNRTMEFNAIDQILFRPVLHCLLGLERWLFGHDFLLWQLTSLLLHLCVVWMLLKTLLNEGRHVLAPLFALFFSVQYASMDMVIWHHLSGYLLFSVFLLAAIYNLRKYGRERSARRGVLLAVFLLLAAFTYELGNAVALLMAGYMILSNLFSRDRARFGWGVIACAMAIPVAYATLSLLDLYVRFGDLSAIGQITSAADHSGTAGKIMLATFLWLYSIAFPTFIDLIAYERVYLIPLTAGTSLPDIVGIIALGALVGSHIFIWRETLTKEFAKRNAGMVILVFLCVLAYAAIIVIGRANERGFWRTMAINSYYTYIFSLLGIVLLYMTIDFSRLRRALPQAGLAAGLLVLVFINAPSVYSLNLEMADYSKPRIEFVEKIEKLVQEHAGEEGFSFSVSGDCRGLDFSEFAEQTREMGVSAPIQVDRPGNDILTWLKRRGDPLGKTYTLAEALYPKHYVRAGGKYEVSCAGAGP